MGANFIEIPLDGKLTEAELRQKFNEMREQSLREDGASYSGEIGMATGLIVRGDKKFDSHDQAADWLSLDGNCEKHGDAVAVRYQDVRMILTKKPTFGGVEHNGAGRWKSFTLQYDRRASDPKFVPADKLTANQKARLEKLYKAAIKASEPRNAASLKLLETVNRLNKTEEPFNDWAELKSRRKLASQTQIAYNKAIAALEAEDAKRATKLYAKSQKDFGEKWLIGATCAS